MLGFKSKTKNTKNTKKILASHMSFFLAKDLFE